MVISCSKKVILKITDALEYLKGTVIFRIALCFLQAGILNVLFYLHQGFAFTAKPVRTCKFGQEGLQSFAAGEFLIGQSPLLRNGKL